nr:MAG TPA: hypothetical protein [Microviridae sp.]
MLSFAPVEVNSLLLTFKKFTIMQKFIISLKEKHNAFLCPCRSQLIIINI